MKLFLQATLLSFVFVADVLGQGYGRRPPKKPAVPKPHFAAGPTMGGMIQGGQMMDGMFQGGQMMDGMFQGGQMVGIDPMDNGLGLFQGGGAMPDHIKKIIGSTVDGKEIIGGMTDGFPRHGGTLNVNGLVNGWGSDANVAPIPAVTMWKDPLEGRPFPRDYAGGEIDFSSATSQVIGHQVAKSAHVAAKTGGIMGGGPIATHNVVKAEHNMAKEANHMTNKAVAGMNHIGVAGMGAGHAAVAHNINKNIAATGGYPKRGSFGPKKINHDIVKSSGPISVGHVGVDHPGTIAHNIGKATLGADAMMGHNIAKASGNPVGVGFINPAGPVAQQVEHDIAKSTGNMMVNPFSPVVGAGQIGHDIAKATGGLITGSAGHNIHKAVKHDTVKSSGIITAGKPMLGHNVVKSGPVSVGHVGVDHPGTIAHNIGKATLGADAMMGHNIAKASGTPVGVGFINPAGPVAQQVQHDIAKSTGNMMVDPFGPVVGGGQIGHNIAKASGSPVGVGFINPAGAVAQQVQHDIAKSTGNAMVGPFGGQISHGTMNHQAVKTGTHVGISHIGQVGMKSGVIGSNPVHNVNKVGHSGMAQMGHDPLASTLGHGIAKQVVGEAAALINRGSGGGVSAGNPIAIAATHGLVKESLHVADKTVNMANGGAVAGTGHIGTGVFGHGPIVPHPKPVKPKRKPVKFPTGYAGRQRY